VTASGATVGVDSYGYDNAGNTTTRNIVGKPGQTLTWDPEGHLASVTDSGGTTSYLYTADGDRLLTYEPGNVATLYLDGYELRRTTTGVTCTRYYGVAARTTTGGLTWTSADHHGTGQLAINPTTLAITRRKTDPFGNPRGTPVTWPTTRGFVNGTQDPTGLTHLGAREYEPAAGRFISVDPLLDLADPLQMNGYTYANSNPSTNSDPSGLMPCTRLDDRSGPCISNAQGVVDYTYTADPVNNINWVERCTVQPRGCNPPNGIGGGQPPPTTKTEWGFDNGVSVIVRDGVATIYIPGTAPYRLPPGADPYAVGYAVGKMIGSGFKNYTENYNHEPAPHIVGKACQSQYMQGACSKSFMSTISTDAQVAMVSGDSSAPANYTDAGPVVGSTALDLAMGGAASAPGRGFAGGGRPGFNRNPNVLKNVKPPKSVEGVDFVHVRSNHFPGGANASNRNVWPAGTTNAEVMAVAKQALANKPRVVGWDPTTGMIQAQATVNGRTYEFIINRNTGVVRSIYPKG
jgi:RHS repeat-associated protein